MRRSSSTTCRAGLSVAAALVLLTACGGSDEEGSASGAASGAASSAASGSPAAPGTEEPAESGFCTEAASIQERLQATVTQQSDPTRLPQILDEAATEIRAVEAPEEIAADWTALADGVERFSDVIAGIDFADPNAVSALEQQLTPLQQELDTASTDVATYLRDECGIDVPTGG